MLLPKWNRYTRYEKLITAILLVFLIGYSFFPKYINVDKYTMMLLALLVLIAVMPYISSAKLPYFLEFKKKVKLSKK
jgi:cellobiose-specific phosphotransferase system component IIC